MMRNVIVFVAIASILAGCASTNRTKILQTMAVAGTAGIVYGLTRPSYPQTNAAVYSGLAAAVAGVAGHFIWNSDKEAENYRIEAETYRAEIARIQKPIGIASSPATFGAAIPLKYQSLVSPGEWRVSELDQWDEDGENRLIHQDLLMELTPPTLNPKSMKGKK